MKQQTQTILFVAAIALSACGDNSTIKADSTQVEPKSNIALNIAMDWESARAGKHQTSFQLGQTTDLVFAATMPGQKDGAEAMLDLYSPAGLVLTRYKVNVSDERATFVVPIAGATLGKNGYPGSYAAIVKIAGKDVVTGAFELRAPLPLAPSTTVQELTLESTGL